MPEPARDSSSQPAKPSEAKAASSKGSQIAPLVLLLLVAGVGAAAYYYGPDTTIELESTVEQELPSVVPTGTSDASNAAAVTPRSLAFGEDKQLHLWWERLGAEVNGVSAGQGAHSNISPADYVGAEACQKCHEKNYNQWSQHAHRWMNTEARTETVKGDFGGATISYLGGQGTFLRAGSDYRMVLERDGTRREYQIVQTIGSRFFQYYVGHLLSGPEPESHPFYREDHVLPFGYWLDEKMWVPIVHVGPEEPDGKRPDPFQPPEGQPFYQVYANKCSCCHSTYPVGDWLIREADLAAFHMPTDMHFEMGNYLQAHHPELLQDGRPLPDYSPQDLTDLLTRITNIKHVGEHVASFGITCEACHFGAREHAEGKLKRPFFYPASQFLETELESATAQLELGRTHQNLNWTCARCHTGNRPQYGNGISTWNSTEYSDAQRGSCYSQMTCIDCHNPHETIGKKWTRTDHQDTATCLKCHDTYRDEHNLVAHTHHAADSAGSQCMNCHMPRLNEGLQDMVRTHTIFSPTDRDMLEGNQPNACNMCHTDWPIHKTATHLKQWYGREYSQEKIAENYPLTDQSAVINWIRGDQEAVRLVAADSLFRTDSRWALPDLIDALDDPFLLNRQFASKGIQKMLGIQLDDYGYRFYMTPAERAPALEKLRSQFLPSRSAATPSVAPPASE